ncbi:MAG: outer membrane beta-barrel protein [Bacteroidota bacterium]
MNKQLSIYKYVGMFAALMMLTLVGFAQEEREEENAQTDSTEIIFKNRRIIIIADEEGKRVEIKEITEEEGEEVEESEVIIIEEEEEDEYDYTIEEVEEIEEDGYDEDYEYNEGDNEDWDDEDYDHQAKKKKSGKRTDVDFIGFDLGLTNYYNSATSQYGLAAAPTALAIQEFRPGSHVALHLFPTTASLVGRGAVNLKTALTIDWTQMYFSSNVLIQENGGTISFSESPNDLSKNKLSARYVQMPLLLNINTDPGGKDGLSVSFGVFGGLLWKGWTKQEYASNGQTIVDKVDGSYGLSPIRYGLMARVDFKWFDIYGMYNMTPLFEAGSGVENTQTVMFGVNLINF